MGKVLKCKKVAAMPLPDSIIEKTNQWGAKPKHEHYGQKKFLNGNKEKFDWDNDKLEDNEGLVKDTEISHPELTSKLPGIELESKQARLVEAVQEVETSKAQEAESDTNSSSQSSE